jgi:hypothetical protein
MCACQNITNDEYNKKVFGSNSAENEKFTRFEIESVRRIIAGTEAGFIYSKSSIAYNTIYIHKREDEWFFLNTGDGYFKCDQLDQLVEFLRIEYGG